MSHKLKLILPKGRIQKQVLGLLEQIGLNFTVDPRSYRPACNDPDIEAKIFKTQNIPPLVALGRHDCGFAGHDWVLEQNAEVTQLYDLGFDPVRIVAAVPEELAEGGEYKRKRVVLASEYRNLAQRYIKEKGLDAAFVQTYGATEALPPDDADIIIDNTSTGETLARNRLRIVDTVLESTTRFICHPAALEDPWKKGKLDELCMLMKSAINARQRVLLEMNVPKDCFDEVVKGLPAMRSPTVSPLQGGDGFAVKIAVPKTEVRGLIVRLMALGARDILEYRLEKIVT